MSLLPQSKKSAGEIAKLRESLGIPGQSPAGEELPAETPVIDAAPEPAAHELKPVRSLRKSEQAPSPVIPPPPDSKLPGHRHSGKELDEIRRQEAIARLAPAVHPQSLIAHPLLVISGYLFAAAGGVGYYFYQLEIISTAGCVAVALLVAALIFLKAPYSRHHAAFIAVMALFVIIFGALHYFPQLRHGT